jgi:hypothetical protein
VVTATVRSVLVAEDAARIKKPPVNPHIRTLVKIHFTLIYSNTAGGV